MRTMTATEFKAKCLAVLDDVKASGETVTILKRGEPVAQLVPPAPVAQGYPQEALRGTVTFHGDVIGPALPADAWDAERGEGS